MYHRSHFMSIAHILALSVSPPGNTEGGAGAGTWDFGCNPVCLRGDMDCRLLILSNSLEIY